MACFGGIGPDKKKPVQESMPNSRRSESTEAPVIFAVSSSDQMTVFIRSLGQFTCIVPSKRHFDTETKSLVGKKNEGCA